MLQSNAKDIDLHAAKLLNHKEPRAHNLALMDLGSLVCFPKNPDCNSCPLREQCQGREEPECYTQTKKTAYESLELFYGICIENNRVALVKTEGSMYKGMLTLPSVDPIEENFLRSFKHAYTKYRLTVKLYKLETIEQECIWVDVDKLHNAPLSSLVKKALGIS